MGRDGAVVQRRIEAAPEPILQAAAGLRFGDLVESAGQQVQQANAPGERLSNPFHQTELLRAGEHEQPGAPVPVDAGLQVGEQVGDALSFIDNGAVGILGEKTARVGGGECAHVGVFEAGVRLVRKCRASKRGLAGLTRPGNGGDRIVAGQFYEARRRKTRNHAVSSDGVMQIVKEIDNLHYPRFPSDQAATLARTNIRMVDADFKIRPGVERVIWGHGF
jgi:hypothetical protein